MEICNKNDQNGVKCNGYLSEEDIKVIIANYGHNKSTVENYTVRKASDSMLGFLADYWKLELEVKSNGETKILSFFIKAVSKNAAKADMVKKMKLFDMEWFFYSVVKRHLKLPGIEPWSPDLVAILNDTLVFEDLNVRNYVVRNKFKRFDLPHTFQALNALARFHASSLIFEEKKSKELKKEYRIGEEFKDLGHVSGYKISDCWCKQCMNGALAAIKQYSKHKFSQQEMAKISSNWDKVWSRALNIHNLQSGTRNVICHRDLWNNNIMFHYKNCGNDTVEPNDCVFVDFQGVRYQQPASDVMLLLHCNLDPNLRQEHMEIFLDHYYERMKLYLSYNQLSVEDIMPQYQFKRSAHEQSIWGLVACSCLMPQFWIEDRLSTQIFLDNKNFNEIMSENKAAFIIDMMEKNQNYKEKVMEIFNELAEKALIC